jgi:two-component system, cell cycle sensor histidine kinase and response regulator CckA
MIETGGEARLAGLGGGRRMLLLAGLCCLVLGLLALPGWPPVLVFGAVAGGIAALVPVSFGLRAWHRHGQAGGFDKAAALLGQDPAPSFRTGMGSTILWQNDAARDRYGGAAGQGLAQVMGAVLPNAGALVARQLAEVAARGVAQESVPTPRGALRVTTFRTGSDLIWRIEDWGAQTHVPGAGIALPMAVLDAQDRIVSMNAALRSRIGGGAESLGDLLVETEPEAAAGAERRARLVTAEGQVTVRALIVPGRGGGREFYAIPEELVPFAMPVAARTFDALPVALVHIGAQGEVLAVNRPAQQLLGTGVQGAGTLSALVEGLGRPVNDWVMDTLAGRIPDRSEVVRVRHREEEVFVQITLGRIMDGTGPSVLAVLHDATELKTLELQFVQSQKMQAIGELAGGVAHDFNNLLTAIGGHCDLLMLRRDRGDPDFADLEQISQNANRAAALVGQLLAFSRKQTLEPEILDLRETMGELMHLLNRLVGEKIMLTLEHDPALLPIRADRRQLDQVIMNLVVNARDAMPEGGEIRVETRVTILQAPMLRDRAEVPAGRYVTIGVHDQGHGIPPDRLARIFEPFYTTKRVGEGTGLGLSMAYGIVKQTGGYIFVDSEVGVGSSFTIYCPAYDLPDEGVGRGAQASLPAAPAPRAPPHVPGRTDRPVILLVEDEAPVRAFAARALRMSGYEVIETASGEEALGRLAERGQAVDLFLTDVVMPGMDGPTWVREALQRRPDVRVIFVSGYAEDQIENGSIDLPNSVFLPKPYSLADLTATVARLLA